MIPFALPPSAPARVLTRGDRGRRAGENRRRQEAGGGPGRRLSSGRRPGAGKDQERWQRAICGAAAGQDGEDLR
jgi:hypothetical protein